MKKKSPAAQFPAAERWSVSEGADYENDAFIISTKEIKQGIEHYGPDYVAHITIQGDEAMSYDDVKERARKRARLISAAPDLLAFAHLINAQDEVTYPDDTPLPVKQLCNLINSWRKEAKAAIRKAEGLEAGHAFLPHGKKSKSQGGKP